MGKHIWSRIFGGSSNSSTSQRSHRRSTGAGQFEPLEGRQLLSGAQVISVVADNRGETQVTLNEPIVPSNVTKQSVLVFTAGADKVINTADDTHVGAPVRFEPSGNRIIIKGRTKADEVFRIRLVASKLKDASGNALDGDFNGTYPSGNGTAGGNFAIQAKPYTGALPTARFSTSEGILDVRLFRGASSTNIATPHNVANFLSFANGGDYDSNWVARSVPGFIVQWGGVNVNSKGQIGQVPGVTTPGSVTGEPGNSNVRGTLAYALSAGPNTADNEFFFNIVNNNADKAAGVNLDDASNGGPFTVFGKAANSRALGVLDAINGLHRVNLSQALSGIGSDVQDVPVSASVPVTGEGQHGGTTTKKLNPLTDFVYIRRVAVLMTVSKLA